MEKEENKEYNSVIRERKVWNQNNVMISVIIGLIVIFSFIALMIIFSFEIQISLIIATLLVVIYATVLFFLLEPSILREVERVIVQQSESKPIIKEVIVEKPVIKEIPVTREIEKPIYIVNQKRRLNIEKFEFLGSSQTGVYHKRSCRLSKLIKKKYKVLRHDEDYFKKNNYKPCDVCIKKIKKV